MDMQNIVFIVADEDGFWEPDTREIPVCVVEGGHTKIVRWALDAYYDGLNKIVYVGVFDDNPED